MSEGVRGCPLCFLRTRWRRLVGAVQEWRPKPWRLRAAATFPFVGRRSLRTAFQADFFSGQVLCTTKYLVSIDKRSAGPALGLDAAAGPVSTGEEKGACASN